MSDNQSIIKNISMLQQYREIASAWFNNREMNEIAPLVKGIQGKKSFRVYLNVCSAVRSQFGYEAWVLFLSELIKINPHFQTILQENITNSFAKIIVGTEISTKKSRIKSSRELYEAIKFLESNSPLKGPEVSDVRKRIQETIVKKEPSEETWKRIASVLPNIDEEYIKLQEIKQLLTNLNMKRTDLSENTNFLPRISTARIRKQIKKCQTKQDETCIEIYEELLFKKRIRRKRVKREIIANLAFLYGLKYESNYDLVQDFLSISEQVYLGLKRGNKVAECQYNIMRIFYQREVKRARDYLAFHTLELIKKKFTMDSKSHLFLVASKFLVKSFFEMFKRFEEKNIFGIAEDCLDYMQILIEKMKEGDDLFFQIYDSKIKDKRVKLKNITPRIIFVFDTSFLCSIFVLNSVDNKHELKAIFQTIEDFFQLHSEIQYVATSEIINEIPSRFANHIEVIQKMIQFQKYRVDSQQIENMKIFNSMYTRRSFDQDELSDYIIIQTAVNHKSSENIVIVVSNDEGIHNYCKKNLLAKKISVIWCHSLIEFISKNEKVEEDSKKLHNLSRKMKRSLEKYRREKKRRKIENYPIEQLLLSLDLEKR